MNGGAYENQNVDAGQLIFLTNTIALVENATLSEWNHGSVIWAGINDAQDVNHNAVKQSYLETKFSWW